jgi:hypothetical protein
MNFAIFSRKQSSETVSKNKSICEGACNGLHLFCSSYSSSRVKKPSLCVGCTGQKVPAECRASLQTRTDGTAALEDAIFVANQPDLDLPGRVKVHKCQRLEGSDCSNPSHFIIGHTGRVCTSFDGTFLGGRAFSCYCTLSAASAACIRKACNRHCSGWTHLLVRNAHRGMIPELAINMYFHTREETLN